MSIKNRSRQQSSSRYQHKRAQSMTQAKFLQKFLSYLSNFLPLDQRLPLKSFSPLLTTAVIKVEKEQRNTQHYSENANEMQNANEVNF